MINNSNTKGFTLAELLIASVILSILLLTAASVYTNFFNSVRNIRAANVVYEEARFTMERIVSEVRLGSIDYEEYYNQANNFFGTGTNETYGDNYCQYSRQFYAAGPDGEFGTFDDEPTGERDPNTTAPIENRIQPKLYLIDVSGTRRTYVQRVEATDSFGNTIGKVAMLKLEGQDWGIDNIDSADATNNCIQDNGEGDDLIDTWTCAEGFRCFTQATTCAAVGGGTDNPDRVVIRDDPSDLANSSFIDITPEALDIVDIQFFITPQDDPRKAYNDPLVQIQPNVTIKLIARANPSIASQFRGSTPNIVIESTISARAQSEIVTECNLQECIETTQKACPKIGNVCGGAMQTCTGSVWPGCSDGVYITHSDTNNGLDLDPVFDPGGRTYYEAGTEFASCSGTPQEVFDCKTRRCTDTFDNDCDGLTDESDPDCLFFLCNNGAHDPQIGEVCIDVGGQCQNFRPLEPGGETTCGDGYDNDCNYVDNYVWSNPGAGEVELTAQEKAIILADPAGYDENSEVFQWNLALRQGADEYDQNCIDIMCNNTPNPITGEGDTELGEFEWDGASTRIDYLKNKPYAIGAMDEACPNIGGLCDRATEDRRLVADEGTEDAGGTQTPGYLCSDGLDNDCDFVTSGGAAGTGADELDDDCHNPLCSNNAQDCDLIDTSLIGTEDYAFDFIVNYSDTTCVSVVATDLDEECEDAGGICGAVHGGTENDLATCTDGKDNNCNGVFDGNQASSSDTGCCPDTDLDGFLDTSDPWCTTSDKIANVAPDFAAFGLIDCNDQDSAIKPETGGALTPEVCDNARYPVGHPQEDAPIDNNCSSINEIYGALPDDGLDSSDPACCVDLDGDGFGIETAYLYNQGGSCSNNSGTLDGNFDCNDFDDQINPSASENSFAECTNGINENCNFNASQVDRTDHIDMYPDLALAFTDQLFEPDCCNLAAPEVCNDGNSFKGDGSDSDENCNGLEGLGDHYCTDASNLSFNNNFTDPGQGHMSSFSGVIYNSADPGTITLPDTSPNGTATSAVTPLLSNPPCNDISSATISHVHDPLPASGEIEYELSNNNGATWCGDDDCAGDTITSSEILAFQDTANFPGSGDQLVWRATLSATGETVVLDRITLDFTCN